MTVRCESEVESVGGEDYQRVYLPARLTRDSQYQLEPGDTVTVVVVSGAVLIGRPAAVDDLVTNLTGGESP